ncbi:hypothetical protein PAMC26510_33735 [Caballeronia sordidicola]|uniref:Uncharacterized protein n=1 Tax=Caballeronia sordidicola TaxID=196367 RepID=A0A242M700_CABSO|nr:hypothetical protein PAMC26510_33735 [Caballeronia sordidicola]
MIRDSKYPGARRGPGCARTCRRLARALRHILIRAIIRREICAQPGSCAGLTDQPSSPTRPRARTAGAIEFQWLFFWAGLYRLRAVANSLP